jgi:hypothetical protein
MLAVSLAILSKRKLATAVMSGQAADGVEIVRLADEAHAAAPSKATRSALYGALAYRVGESAAARNAGYASLAAKWRRTVGPLQLLSVTLSAPGPARDSILADPDAQRLLALAKELDADFPQDRGPSLWALFCEIEPATAARIAESAVADEAGKLNREIESRLAAKTPAYALSGYWEARMAGDAKTAEAALQALAEVGFELPQP